jgi:hypothetical protein
MASANPYEEELKKSLDEWYDPLTDPTRGSNYPEECNSKGEIFTEEIDEIWRDINRAALRGIPDSHIRNVDGPWQNVVAEAIPGGVPEPDIEALTLFLTDGIPRALLANLATQLVAHYPNLQVFSWTQEQFQGNAPRDLIDLFFTHEDTLKIPVVIMHDRKSIWRPDFNQIYNATPSPSHRGFSARALVSNEDSMSTRELYPEIYDARETHNVIVRFRYS